MRNTIAVLALLGYLTAALGLPLPARASPPDITPADSIADVRPCGCVVSDCESACCCCGPSPIEQVPSDDSMIWVIGEQVRKCHGMETLWLSVGIALPMPPPVHIDTNEPPLCRLSFNCQLFDTLTPCPPAPPPRA
jgi:hypothetical protein